MYLRSYAKCWGFHMILFSVGSSNIISILTRGAQSIHECTGS